jgi:hypothetical protein
MRTAGVTYALSTVLAVVGYPARIASQIRKSLQELGTKIYGPKLDADQRVDHITLRGPDIGPLGARKHVTTDFGRNVFLIRSSMSFV